MKDFNFQLFGVLRGSTLGFDGSPSWYLTFYLNLSGRGVIKLHLFSVIGLQFDISDSHSLYDILGYRWGYD